MKKLIALLMALTLVLGAFAMSASAEEPIEISIFGTDMKTGSVYLADGSDNFPMWKALEEKFNVKFTFNTSTSYTESIQVRLAAGEQLEDLFCIGYYGIEGYAKEGLFMALDELIAEYAPNLSAFYAENPQAYKYNVYPGDGKQYAISESEYYYKELGDMQGILIRQDWLDELGLPLPTTLDGLFDTLMTFKENKMGGGNPVVLGNAPMESFSIAFGLRGLYESYVDVDENGNVVLQYLTDAYKDLIKFMKKLYENDLLLPQWQSMNNDITYQTIAMNNAAIQFTNPATLNKILQYYLSGDPDVKLTLLDLLEGPNGDRVAFACPTEWKRYIIPADTEEAKAIKIIQILDYTMGTKEGRSLYWYGVEGDTMEYDEDGVPKFVDEIRLAGDFNLIANKGLQVQCIPTVYAPLTKYDAEAWPWEIYEQTVAYSAQLTPGIHFLRNPMTDEVREMVDKPDLNTYRGEIVIKFITGELDIDENWDDYLATCEELGASELLAGYQLHYDMLYKK